MFLLVGLGNPGSEYENTRHNVGFIAADAIAGRYNFAWSNKSKFYSDIALGETELSKLILCKPDTFMNLSGKAVQAICAFYKIPPENVIIIQDEIDLPTGKIKHKIGGGHGGHNGLKSIDSVIGPNYHRIRIGVGRPDDPRHDVSDYVLGKFGKDEQQIIDEKIVTLLDALPDLLGGDVEGFKKKVGG